MPTIEPAGQTNQITQTVNTKTASQILAGMQAAKQPAPSDATVPAAPTEAASPAEAPKEPTENDKRLQALTIKEKQILKERQELKRLTQELQTKYKPWEEASEVSKQSKLEAMRRLGFTYDDLTNEFLGVQNMTPDQVAEAKAQAIVEQRLKEFEDRQQKQSVEVQQQQYDRAIKQIKADAKSITESSQNYPLVKTMEAYDTIVELMESTHNDSDRLMSVEEAIKQVETDLKTYVLSLATVPEIRSELLALLQPVKQSLQAGKSPTLTNKTTATPVAAADVSVMTSSQKEAYYRQRAIAAIEGRL